MQERFNLIQVPETINKPNKGVMKGHHEVIAFSQHGGQTAVMEPVLSHTFMPEWEKGGKDMFTVISNEPTTLDLKIQARKKTMEERRSKLAAIQLAK